MQIQNTQYTAGAQKFSAAQQKQPQQGAPKFGLLDGGCCSIPCCCGVPVALGGLAILFLAKNKIKNAIVGLGRMIGEGFSSLIGMVKKAPTGTTEKAAG